MLVSTPEPFCDLFPKQTLSFGILYLLSKQVVEFVDFPVN